MTRREQLIVGLIGEGLSNNEIAHRLNIAPNAVEGIVRRLLSKLDLRTRLDIAAYARRNGKVRA